MSYRTQDPGTFYREDNDENGNPSSEPTNILVYSGMNWARLPTDFISGCIKDITVLDLDDNLLTELPSSLVKALPCLEKLDVARNQLTQLPPNIGDWKRLREISVPSNRIDHVPVSVSQLKHLVYFNMDMNPMNAALKALLPVDLRWDVKGCQEFARKIYYLASQVPRAFSETERNTVHVAQFGPKKPPIVLKIESKPGTRRGIPQLVGKGKKTKEPSQSVNAVKPLGLKPLVFCTSRTPKSFRRSAREAPPVVTAPTANEPEAPVTLPDPIDSAWLPDDAVVDDRNTNQVLEIASEMFDTRIPDVNMNAAQEIQEVPETSIAAYVQESVTGIADTESVGEPTRASLLFRAFMTVFVCISELTKMATYGCCAFGVLVAITSLVMDQEILEEYLARPWINYILPNWFQTIFLRHHHLAITHLVAYCVYFPIYKSPPKTLFAFIINCIYGVITSLFNGNA